MSHNDPLATVKRMFETFKEGDLDALLETVHPDSRWVYVGANPRLSKKVYAGRAEVRRFFEGILKHLTMTAFNTDEFVVQGDTVVVFGSETGTMKRSGEAFHNEWAQKYVVRDNQIVEMAEYNVRVEDRST